MDQRHLIAKLRVVAVALLFVVGACASMPSSKSEKPLADNPPILFVHGINDTHTHWSPLMQRVLQEGAQHVQAMDYLPNDGSASIADLSKQVDVEAAALMKRTGAKKIDVVAFSLGTQLVRHWMVRRGGREHVRRFVGISGPFAGTAWAHLGFSPVGEELAPGSAFLADLAKESYAPARLTTIYTPLDTVIVPPSSCVVDEADENISISVVLHPLMYKDERVHDVVVRTLAKETIENQRR